MQEIPEFLEQYKDGATTQAEKRFDALDHPEELGKHGTDIFNTQATGSAGGDSWNDPANLSSGGLSDGVAGDGWGSSIAKVVDDGWGAGTADAGSSW